MKAPAFSVVLLLSLASHAVAQSSIESPIPAATPSTEPQSGVRAGFWWADYDRDGLEDAFAIGADGAARLLHNSGDGSFADVTLITGLDGLGSANFAAWQDFDRDGSPDVFIGAQSGPGHLMRNAGDNTFQDVTQFVGLDHAGRQLAAQWFDYDLDGLVDLAVRTDGGEHLYHALSNGHFEAVDLGRVPQLAEIAGARSLEEADASAGDPAASDTTAPRKPGAQSRRVAAGAQPVTGPGITPAGPSWTPSGGSPLNMITCIDVIKNQATATCISVSSTPTLGWLYPLTINLNVSGAGNVGIGTTSPSFKLDVAGTARMSDTLTLNPAGDQALNLSAGSIYKNGLLFAHTNGGNSNTALGKQALSSATSGSYDTASGYRALQYNTSGFANTAVGEQAMRMNTTGFQNTAVASYALKNNSTGRGNTATGYTALFSNTTGSFNTATGLYALRGNTSGSYNTAAGRYALFGNSIGSLNTATGDSALAFNTTGGGNVAAGFQAMNVNTSGYLNTATGMQAMLANTTGSGNVATGYRALASNTTGYRNTATGIGALLYNTSGSRNTAMGDEALRYNTSGYDNTASGYGALYSNTTGSFNIAIGRRAGAALTTGSSNIAIGNLGVAGEGGTIRIGGPGIQTRAFIAGIRGVTTGAANAIPVVIDSAGQLGTVSSSRRFKQDIADMGDATSRLLELRPVRFRYKQEQTMPDGSEVPMEYGLIAEEVAEIFPDLVVYDDEGKPFTVKYHILSSMLLNEMKKMRSQFEERLATLEARSPVPGSASANSAENR